MLNFVEPNPNTMFIDLVKCLWPLYAKLKYGSLKVKFSPEVVADLRRLKKQATIICPNHAASMDADVVFALSRQVRSRFAFLAARELFAKRNSLAQRWLQMLGCYSIERGTIDIQAFVATRELLQSKEVKIVIFPEGEISHHNDHLLPLENGVEHMALAAMEERRDNDITEPIFIVPLALKYRYSKDVRPAIETTVQQLEGLVLKEPSPERNLSQRIKRLFLAVLDALERQHSLPSNSDKLNARIYSLRERLIIEAELFLQLSLPKSLGQLSRLHKLKSKFAERRWGEPVLEPSVKRTRILTDLRARALYHQLNLATSLIAVGEHSFDHDLTQEEAAELVQIIEKETQGKITLKAPDIVLVGSAKAIDVSDYMPKFGLGKKEAVSALKAELCYRLQDKLHQLAQTYEPFMIDDIESVNYAHGLPQHYPQFF